MALQELLRAMEMFGEGVQSLGQSISLKKAQKEIKQVNEEFARERGLLREMQDRFGADDPELKGEVIQDLQRLEAENRLKANALRQQLSAGLASTGLDAATINSVVGQLGPSEGAQFQAKANEELQQKSQDFQAEQRQIDRMFELSLHATKGSKGDDPKQKANILNQYNKFRSETKQVRDAITQVDSTLNRLEDPELMDISSVTRAIKTLIRLGGESRISDQDVLLEMPGGTTNYREAARFLQGEYTAGRRIPGQDRELLIKLLKNAKEARIGGMIEEVDSIAQQADLLGTTPEKLKSRLESVIPGLTEFRSNQKKRSSPRSAQPVVAPDNLNDFMTFEE